MLEVVLRGPISRAEIASLCDGARALLDANDAELVVVDLDGLVDPDVVTVDAMARLQVTARRLGRGVRFRGACREVHELVALTGLGEVLHFDDGSRFEPRGETEQREHGLGVEEEGDP